MHMDWVAYPFSRESSQPRDQTQVSCIVSRPSLEQWPGQLMALLEWVVISVSRESFATRRSNPHLLHWQVGSLPLSHLGSHLALFTNP